MGARASLGSVGGSLPTRPAPGGGWARRLGRAASACAGALGVAYFVLWACAPTTAFAPATAPGGSEIGVGLSATTNRLDDGEDLSALSAALPSALDGQVWFNRRFDTVSVGLTFFAGETSVVGVGFHLRAHAFEVDDLALAVPTHLRLSDATLLYANPSIGMRIVGVQLPVGVLVERGGASFSGAASLESGAPPGELGGRWLGLPRHLRLGLGVGGQLPRSK